MEAVLSLIFVLVVMVICHECLGGGVISKILIIVSPVIPYMVLDFYGSACCDGSDFSNIMGLLLIGLIFAVAVIAAEKE